jgi:NAD(P)H-hydrate epimerase
MVLDADGINNMVGACDELSRAGGRAVLTPHPGEMSRLTGHSVGEVQGQRRESVLELAARTGCVVALKGAGTLVASPDGRLSVNTTGGPLLGVGGTGDVLAGLIGSLLAQKLEPYDAARLGVYLHGLAADRLSVVLGDAGLLASELADEMPRARRDLVAAHGAR